ncbi:dTDP-4-dehydrorhamnose reductase [Gilvimarinus agarilyticus]|uniref:dTDP-4-dehydrorhamnose reductase n=1 Tax=Gilvimarinus sp. 2_MG-2023 TaxID=3062666 RepID=UPI001C089EC1|nr:dTDP-4-dehydrorhamnose reductase [Gilvimarinus sp. 2_MG-2023]MBU2887569.1 dTDP-4-dehydrorhamnose reductase [Gilvimarinus agarilyticus]MDO6572220.1 dTDP-4-dehydrorhamnose reductase [Gilvimarinus sp. 2_MG-2023]
MSSEIRILVLGCNGQVGSEIKYLQRQQPDHNEWIFWQRSDLDLTDTDAIETALTQCRPTVVINCAAYTAVDKAEQEPELADQINHLAVRALAQTCQALGACLIHISTDYVFSGTHCQPYRPQDATAPAGHYGLSKLRGEQTLRASGVNGVIVRTSWVYSTFGNNFVKTMLRLGAAKPALQVVADQIGSPTWARDLAQALMQLAIHPDLAQKTGEIYHYSNSGVCSWYDLAAHIFQAQNLDCQLSPIRTEEYPTPAKRPYYSVLDCRKIYEDFGVRPPYWHHSLVRALKDIQAQ